MGDILGKESKMVIKSTENFEEYKMTHFAFSLTFHASLHCLKVLFMFTNMGKKTYITTTLLDFHL